MQDMFAYRYRTYPEEVAEEGLKKTVDILLRERGCTLDTLLEDEVFESFPWCDTAVWAGMNTRIEVFLCQD
jgi:hypothetical protein